jgi:sigma-B regulation protein RsbU (phosphoserine phosphatase)
MAKPELVLSTLNELFQMDDHNGLYFTIWYGVYDARTRRLDFASGGHHPAYLVPADRAVAMPLRTRNLMIGAMPAAPFACGSVTVPHAASLYLFSDGVYEIVDYEGRDWSIEDFVAIILEQPAADAGELERLYQAVRSQAQSSTLDDDFSLVVVNFD